MVKDIPTSSPKEVNYLKECWEKCMENKQQIPLNQLCIPDCDGNMVLTRNIINEEEADDGMNSGGDEGDISPIYTGEKLARHG